MELPHLFQGRNPNSHITRQQATVRIRVWNAAPGLCRSGLQDYPHCGRAICFSLPLMRLY